MTLLVHVLRKAIEATFCHCAGKYSGYLGVKVSHTTLKHLKMINQSTKSNCATNRHFTKFIPKTLYQNSELYDMI